MVGVEIVLKNEGIEMPARAFSEGKASSRKASTASEMLERKSRNSRERSAVGRRIPQRTVKLLSVQSVKNVTNKRSISSSSQLLVYINSNHLSVPIFENLSKVTPHAEVADDERSN